MTRDPGRNRGMELLTATVATSTSTTATVTAITAAAAAATTVPNHLSKARINLLLGLLEDIDEITRLLCIWRHC